MLSSVSPLGFFHLLGGGLLALVAFLLVLGFALVGLFVLFGLVLALVGVLAQFIGHVERGDYLA